MSLLVASHKKSLSAQYNELASTYPFKSSKARLNAAINDTAKVIGKSYNSKQWRAFSKSAQNDIISKVIRAGIKHRSAITGEVPTAWRPLADLDPVSKSYVSNPQVNTDAKNIQPQQSEFNLNDCISRRKSQGEPSDEAIRACNEELHNNYTLRSQALGNRILHTDSNTGSVTTQKSIPRISPPLPRLNNTSAYFGRKLSAKEALEKADQLSSDMRANTKRMIQASGIRQAMNTKSAQSIISDIHTGMDQRTGYSLPGQHNEDRQTIRDTVIEAAQRNSKLKNASSNSNDLSWLWVREYKNNPEFARLQDFKMAQKRSEKHLKQASVENKNKKPYWIQTYERRFGPI